MLKRNERQIREIHNASKKKKVLADTSSLILLNKSFLLSYLTSLYQIYITQSVFTELTDSRHSDAHQFQKYYENSDIRIQQTEKGSFDKHDLASSVSHLDEGERDTILLFLEGEADFIILDDGKGARHCIKNEIPFINALLFPRILELTGFLTKSESQIKLDQITNLGRYSERIIRKVNAAVAADLERFLPESVTR